MLKWEDIQIDDIELFKSFQDRWNEGNYLLALDILKNASIAKKWQNARKINELTTRIVNVENLNDPDFKKFGFTPITSVTEPTDKNYGQIWFKIV